MFTLSIVPQGTSINMHKHVQALKLPDNHRNFDSGYVRVYFAQKHRNFRTQFHAHHTFCVCQGRRGPSLDVALTKVFISFSFQQT